MVYRISGVAGYMDTIRVHLISSNLNDGFLFVEYCRIGIGTSTGSAGLSFWISLATLRYITREYRALGTDPSSWTGSSGHKVCKKWIFALGERDRATSDSFVNNRDTGARAKISETVIGSWSTKLTSLQLVDLSIHKSAKLAQASTGSYNRSDSVTPLLLYYYIIILFDN